MYKVLLADDLALTLAGEKECLEGNNLKVFVTTSGYSFGTQFLEADAVAGQVLRDLIGRSM